MADREPNGGGIQTNPLTMPTAADGACPTCGAAGSLRYLVWGMPTPEVFDDPRALLMGCVVEPCALPAYRCVECAADYDDEGLPMHHREGLT